VKKVVLSPMLKRNKHPQQSQHHHIENLSTQWSKAKTHNLQRTKKKIPTNFVIVFTKNSNLFEKKCFSNVNFVICKITTIHYHKIGKKKKKKKNSVLMIEWI